LILAAGVWLVPVTGFYVALIAMTAGYLLQTVWLWFRSRDVDAS
jgi:hypothetical protein